MKYKEIRFHWVGLSFGGPHTTVISKTFFLPLSLPQEWIFTTLGPSLRSPSVGPTCIHLVFLQCASFFLTVITFH